MGLAFAARFRTEVVAKQKHPSWYPPESIRKEHARKRRPRLPKVVPPGPNNPAGRLQDAAGGGGWHLRDPMEPNNPMAVGHGHHTRLYPACTPKDVAALFCEKLPVGNQGVADQRPGESDLRRWATLLMEAHPPVDSEGQNGLNPTSTCWRTKLDSCIGQQASRRFIGILRARHCQSANGMPGDLSVWRADVDSTPRALPPLRRRRPRRADPACAEALIERRCRHRREPAFSLKRQDSSRLTESVSAPV